MNASTIPIIQIKGYAVPKKKFIGQQAIMNPAIIPSIFSSFIFKGIKPPLSEESRGYQLLEEFILDELNNIGHRMSIVQGLRYESE